MASSDNHGWNLQCSYQSLPQEFYSLVRPTPVRNPAPVVLNPGVASMLGFDIQRLQDPTQIAILSGNQLAPGSQPIAQAYAGHQFGGFTMLGDGRAILLGEQVTPAGQLFDLQLKGSGVTPYSRRGDGRAALGPMLREYIISHAMSALGIPTTLSLAVVATGEGVYRQRLEPGAVLTRVAQSHLRVGTFQFAAARGNVDDLRALADYAIDRHYPALRENGDKYIRFLTSVVDRQAALVAQWMSVGFIHGVMNTDNVSIAGETIDYGPCAFMNAYRAATVFSSIDEYGRYAYQNQPAICQWNLARLAETLIPLVHPKEQAAIEMVSEVIGNFPVIYQGHWLRLIGQKIGIQDAAAEDLPLCNQLLSWMEAKQLDFTNTFRDLTTGQLSRQHDDAVFLGWHADWCQRLNRMGDPKANQTLMQRVNPVIIPRNHQVELALAAAVDEGDLDPLRRLLHVLTDPFQETEENRDYRSPPLDGDAGYETYCGT